MSLIYKHHLVLPHFKLQETIPGSNREKQQPLKRYKTLTPCRRLQTERRLPTNITNLGSHTQIETTQIVGTPRSQKPKIFPFLSPRSSKTEEQHLQEYLDHLNTIRKQRHPQKQLINKIRTENEIMMSEHNIVLSKFKKVQDPTQSKKRISLLDTVRNPNSQLYIKFSQQIYSLIHNLHQLKEYLNNQRKLYQVVKNMIGLKKNLKKILIKQNEDDLVEFQDISKLCCINETIYVNGEARVITKFDLTLQDDLIYMCESIEQMLLQTQLQAIKRMSQNIRNEEDEINKLKHTLGLREEDQKLALQTAPMMRYNPHEELENMEQRLGPMNSISRQLRQTSQVIGEMVVRLNDV